MVRKNANCVQKQSNMFTYFELVHIWTKKQIKYWIISINTHKIWKIGQHVLKKNSSYLRQKKHVYTFWTATAAACRRAKLSGALFMAKYKHNLWQKTDMFEYYALVHIWRQSKCTFSNYCRVETNMFGNFELLNTSRKSNCSSSNYV